MSKIFANSFNVQTLGMDKFLTEEGLKGLNLFVTSTFGNGDPPAMAQRLTAWPNSPKADGRAPLVPR